MKFLKTSATDRLRSGEPSPYGAVKHVRRHSPERFTTSARFPELFQAGQAWQRPALAWFTGGARPWGREGAGRDAAIRARPGEVIDDAAGLSRGRLAELPDLHQAGPGPVPAGHLGAGFAGPRPDPHVLGQPKAGLLDDPVKMLSEPFRPSLS